MSHTPNLDIIKINNHNFINYNNKYKNIVFIIKNKNESEIFLKYIQPYVEYDLILTCDGIIEMANSSNEYPIYIRFYYYNNKLHRSWDNINMLNHFVDINSYQKLFNINDLMNGVLYNILVYGKSYSTPNYKPKERPKRILESNNSDYTSAVFQVNNEYESEIDQSNILKNDYSWSSINKNIREFKEYPTYIFIEIKEKIINYTTDSVLKTSTYEDIHNYIKYCNDNGENIIPKIFTYTDTNYIDNIIKNGDTVPSYIPKKNKRILEKKLNEIADYIKIDNKELRHYDDDAYAFLYLDGYENNTFIIKQGLSHINLIGYYLHSIKDNEYMDVYYTEDNEDYLYSRLDGCEFKGRLWLNSKVMGFWDLSCNDHDIEIFKKLIKDIEKRLNIKINLKEWKVEFYDIEKQSTFFVTIEDFINKNINIDDKKTPKEDFEKLKKQHLDINKNKKVPYGFGSKNSKHKPLDWKQALYVEKINNKALNEYDFDAIIIDVKNKNDRDKFLNFIINIEEVYNYDIRLYKTSKYFIIIFNNRGYNIESNTLHYINDDTNTFIENEKYKDYYPQIKHSKPYNVDDAIDIINNIYGKPISRFMYKPKVKNKRILESNNNIYFNPIKNEYTKYKYRFKTKDEFEKEFGDNWNYVVNKQWNDDMDFMFGMDYPYIEYDQFKRVDRFWISMDMLIPNLNKIPTYKPKINNKRILENIKTIYNYNCIVLSVKNIDEFDFILKYLEETCNINIKPVLKINYQVFEYIENDNLYLRIDEDLNLSFGPLSRLEELSDDYNFTYEKIFDINDIKNKTIYNIINYGKNVSSNDMYKPKGKNKRLLENKLNEDCDFVTLPNGNKLSYRDDDAYPFFYINNKFMVGDAGDNHTNLLSDYLYSINDYSDDKLYKYYHNECLFKGRYWLNSKVISFWEYINHDDLKTVLNDLEKHLKIKIDIDEWLLDYYVNNDFDYDSSKNLVSISQYLVANFEDHTNDIEYQRKKEDHFKSPLLKKKYTPKGFGSNNSKYKPLDWKQALYTENFKFDKLPYNMFVFKIGDVDVGYVKNSLKKLGVDIKLEMNIISNPNKLYMFFTEKPYEFEDFVLYVSASELFDLNNFLQEFKNYKSTVLFNTFYEFEDFIKKNLTPTYEPKRNKRLLENINSDKFLNSKYDVFVFKIDPSDNIKDIKDYLEQIDVIYNYINFIDRNQKNYLFLTKNVNNNKKMMLLHCYDDNFTLIKDFINVNNLESSPFFTTFAKLKKFIDRLQLVSSDMYKPKVMNKRILERIEAQMDIPQDIHDFYDLFEKSGKKLYIVGGAVRDYLMGKKPHDFDMVTDAQPDEVVNILKDYRTDIHGAHFGVVRFYTESEPQGYEIASYRKDISKGRNTKGNDKKVETGKHITIKDDVNRRDLTMNALFYNIKTGEIIDTVGGMKDIKDNIIKAVGNPLKRFDEDRLRILRCIRFAAVTGGKIDKETSKAILQDNRLFGISEEDDVSRERIFAEFLKVKEKSRKNADGDIITRFINLLIDYDIMDQIFPVLVTEKNIVSTQYLTVALAQCLRQNRVNDEFKQTLVDAKIPTSYVNIISTLIKIFRDGVDENNVYNLYREIKSNGVRLDILREWIKVMRINDKRVIALLKYQPTTTGHDVMKDGFKKEQIGQEISRRESEKFKELIKTI